MDAGILQANSPAALAAAQGLASVRANVIAALVGGALLLAEFFDTFESEVELIWPSNWSIVKVLYFANRVSPFFVIPLTPIYNFVLNPKPLTCQIMFGMLVLGICTSIIISEVLLYLRLYALSGRKRWALILLACNVTFSSLLANIVLVLFVARGTWGKEVEGVSGCRTIHASNLLVVMGYTTLLYSGLTAMVLSIFFGVRAYWASRRSPLLQVFYRDGTFYFIVLAVMSVGNGISALFLPPGYRYIMGPLQAVMHSTLSTRMVLRLKAQAKHGTGYSISATTDSSGPRSLGSLHFREDTYLFSSPFQLQTTNRNRQLP
ncbi:hypothetical protein BKA70DRAFT_1303225 [Coprinopsis sp. MPI-PUGE-AT-0042]|nr:hypothetical protein BKA70DRAFT_1303225 [Coprinopsis sp. MPI-PUGE-AT-0042]